MPLDFARYKPLLGDYLRLRGISFETPTPKPKPQSLFQEAAK